jgi:hypothetical protein
MMTSKELFANLKKHGVELSLDGENLRYRAPKGVLTSELRQSLTEQKQAILTLLSQPSPIGAAPTVLDERMDFEERAGIMEYDGGLTRVEAERRALETIRGKYTLNLLAIVSDAQNTANNCEATPPPVSEVERPEVKAKPTLLATRAESPKWVVLF